MTEVSGPVFGGIVTIMVGLVMGSLSAMGIGSATLDMAILIELSGLGLTYLAIEVPRMEEDN